MTAWHSSSLERQRMVHIKKCLSLSCHVPLIFLSFPVLFFQIHVLLLFGILVNRKFPLKFLLNRFRTVIFCSGAKIRFWEPILLSCFLCLTCSYCFLNFFYWCFLSFHVPLMFLWCSSIKVNRYRSLLIVVFPNKSREIAKNKHPRLNEEARGYCTLPCHERFACSIYVFLRAS